jgi:hypothetical protein
MMIIEGSPDKITRPVMQVHMHAYPNRQCGECDQPAVKVYFTCDGKPKLMHFKCAKHAPERTIGN